MTKLDSSAKGGVIAALKSDLKLDTFFVGKGEKIDDLCIFDPEAYVQKFFGHPEEIHAVKNEPAPILAATPVTASATQHLHLKKSVYHSTCHSLYP